MFRDWQARSREDKSKLEDKAEDKSSEKWSKFIFEKLREVTVTRFLEGGDLNSVSKENLEESGR